jgi:hypothetical protein
MGLECDFAGQVAAGAVIRRSCNRLAMGPALRPSVPALSKLQHCRRGFLAPEVEQRSLAVYEDVADVAAI